MIRIDDVRHTPDLQPAIAEIWDLYATDAVLVVEGGLTPPRL